MKYEIIKGSEKDFDGAPEWAFSVVKLNRDSAVAWVSGGDDKYQYKYDPDGQYEYVIKGSFIDWDWRDGVEIIAERRPTAEPVVNQKLTTEWSGEGLPPVGVECEHCPGGTTQTEWEVVKVLAINERPGGVFTDFWLQREDGSSYIIGNPYRFRSIRSIRSPEDVGRDEVVKSILSSLINMPWNNEEMAIQIYEAIAEGKIPGVTKTPTVSELMRVTENETREDCEAIVKMLSGK